MQDLKTTAKKIEDLENDGLKSDGSRVSNTRKSEH